MTNSSYTGGWGLQLFIAGTAIFGPDGSGHCNVPLGPIEVTVPLVAGKITPCPQNNDPCECGQATSATGADPVNLARASGGMGAIESFGASRSTPSPSEAFPINVRFRRYQSSANTDLYTLVPGTSNSLAIASNRDGWTHNYNVQLINLSGQTLINDWLGGRRAFTLVNGVYQGDGYSSLTLTNSTYIWHLPHGTRYIFPSQPPYLLSNITDRAGNSLTLMYNASQLLTGVVDYAGRQLSFSYDTNNLLTSVVDPLGRINSFGYDAADRLDSASDALGTMEQYVYGSGVVSNAIVRFINARGYTNDVVFNDAGQVIAETNALGRAQTYSWGVNAVTVTQFDGTQYSIYNNSSGAATSRVTVAGMIQYFRDDKQRLTNIVDRLGFSTQSTWSSNSCACGVSGNLLREIDALGRTNSWTYEPTFSFPLTFTNAVDGVTLWNYDSQGNVTTNTDAAGAVATYGYDGAGNRTSLTDANSHTMTFGYDSYNNRTNVADALTHSTGFSYDLVGRLTGRSDVLGRSESFQWDDRDRLTRYINGASETNRWGYDGNGNRTAWTNELGYVRTYTYDPLDRLTSITLPGDGFAFLTFGYDDANNRTNVTDALGRKTKLGYDALGRLTAVTNALSKVWSFTVDAEGRRTHATDPNTHSQSFVYDAVGQLTGWTNALTLMTTFGYDKLGNLGTVTDPRSNPLTFGYDAVSRLTSITYAGGSSEKFGYDGVGNVTSVTNRAGQAITLTYDAANRPTQKSYVGGNDVIGFGYDNANQLTYAGWTNSSVNVSTLRFAYDAAGRLTNEQQTVAQASALVIGYEYFPDGRRKKLTYPDTTFITYEYNAKGWLTAIKDGGTNSIVTYDYDDAGRRTKRTLENNTFTLYDYDNADQLTSIWHQRIAGATNTISRYQYDYDAAGNRTNMVGTAGSAVRSESYSYDAADQLTGVTYSTNNLIVRAVNYYYDAAGNRTGMVDVAATTTNTTTYTANSDNQLTARTATIQPLTVTGSVAAGAASNKWYASTAATRGKSAGVNTTNGAFAIASVPVTDGANALTVTVTDVSRNIGTQIVNFAVAGTQSLGYDGNGNQTNENGWSYSYDGENRLVSATYASSVVQYSYDALGRPVQRIAGNSTNRLYYAGWQLISENNGAGTLQRKYMYGPGIDEPIRMTAGTTNYYYHADGLGSISEISDSTGAKAESCTYDVYGAPTIYNASGVTTNVSTVGNRLMFTGRDRDPNTGWYNYRYRFYDPITGRFVHKDPAGIASGDFNLYRCVFNNPARWKDSFGLEAIIVFNNGTSLTSPTWSDFLNQLQATDNNSIKSIDIYGHAFGNQTFSTTEGTSNGGITANLTSRIPGVYLLDDSGQIKANITQLLKNKLSKNARIGLRGCYTDGLASDMSHILPNTPIVGSTGPTDYNPQDGGMPITFTGKWVIWPVLPSTEASNWQTYQKGQPQP